MVGFCHLGTFLFLTLSSFLLKAVNVIGLVSICRCKRGRFMSFRKAFGLVHFSASPRLLLVTAVNVMGLVSICPCKGGRLMFLGRP